MVGEEGETELPVNQNDVLWTSRGQGQCSHVNTLALFYLKSSTYCLN